MAASPSSDKIEIRPQTGLASAIHSARSDLRKGVRLAQSAFRHRLIGPLTSRGRPGGVALFHTGRCGSTVLTGLLEQHRSIYWDGETYGRVIEEIKRQGKQRSEVAFDPLEYVRNRLSRSGAHWFGMDLKFSHVTEFGLSVPTYVEGLEQMGFRRIVSLRRENYLRQVISAINGGRRGSFHYRSSADVPALPPLTIDPTDQWVDLHGGSLLDHFQRWDAHYRTLGDTVADDLLSLTYEQHIQDDPRVGADMVVDFLGLPRTTASPSLQRSNPEPLRELLANLDEVREYLAGTPYAWMTDD